MNERTIVGQVDIHSLIFAGWACVPISSSPQAGMQCRLDVCFCYQIQSNACIGGSQVVWPRTADARIEFPDACQLRCRIR
jgi:hypothetical protein